MAGLRPLRRAFVAAHLAVPDRTSACLSALESRRRRPLPTGLGDPSSDPEENLVELPEVMWLEPVPDAVISAERSDPGAIVAARETTRLALVAALQHLPPRQRAVLILREVYRWKAAEVADLLDTTTAAVNSILQRARVQLAHAALTEDEIVEPDSPEQRALLDRYVRALEDKYIPALVELFTAEAIWEMPPFAEWSREHRPPRRHALARRPRRYAVAPGLGERAAPFGVYMRDGEDVFRTFYLQVLTPTAAEVSHVAAFFDVRLFEKFGPPETHPSRSQPAS